MEINVNLAQLNPSERKKLDQYLRGIESIIGKKMSSTNKAVIVSSIIEELLQIKNSELLSMEQVLLRYNDKLSLVNVHLARKGMRPVSRKPFGILKIIFLFFIALILSMILGIILVIKSFTPLINVDDIDGTLEIFGGRIFLNKDDASFFTKINDRDYNEWKKTARSMKGSFELTNLSSIPLSIQLDKGELALRTHEKDQLSYSCLVEQGQGQLFDQTKSGIIMNLVAGKAYCLLYIPQNQQFDVSIRQGHLNLTDLRQHFSVTIEDGILSWAQTHKKDFVAKLVEGSVTKGQLSDFSSSGPYSFNIKVSKGEIRFR